MSQHKKMIDKETIENNIQSQNDEIEVLQSIYDSDIIDKLETERCYEIHLTLHEALAPLIIQFWYPETYPSNDSPNFSARSNWITKEHMSWLNEALNKCFVSGNVVMYEWIEFIKNNLFEELQLENLVSSDSNTIQSELQEELNEEEDDLDNETQEQIDKLNIVHGEIFVEKKSRFVAHVANVHTLDQVNLFIRFLKRDKRIAEATHNIVAYRFEKQNKHSGEILIEENRDDDGEFGAGDPLLFLLQRANAMNVCVVVTRWYGGIQLGPDRFRIILNVAKELLQREEYIKSAKK
jgi:hypothetical protein